MDLVQFNNKYIKKTYQKTNYLSVIFHWDLMLKDPVMLEVKRQIDQLQNPNQIIKIVIDPKKSEEMLHTQGWANTNETQAVYSEKAGQYIDKIIDENRKDIIGILDKYYSDEFDTYMRKLEAENKQEQIDKEINNLCIRGIRYHFYEEIQSKQIVGIVNINEKNMCGKPTQMMRTLLIHEIIHCIDPKLIYSTDIVDPSYHQLEPGDNYQKFKKHKSNKIEIEAYIGELIQKIFDLVNNSTNYKKTKSQIETITQQLINAPKEPIKFFSLDTLKNLIFGKSYLQADSEFNMYTRNLSPNIRRKVLERLSNAVLQAKEMLKTKYISK
jgi:hypothetical protein